MDRVNKFMNNEELQSDAVTHYEAEKNPIIMEKANFKWGKDEQEILSDINLQVENRYFI